MAKPLKSFMIKGIVAGMLLTSISFVACTKRPNEDQLNALEEQKQAALAAEDKVAQKKKEKADLERQLSEKKAELEKVKAEKETVAKRLEGN